VRLEPATQLGRGSHELNVHACPSIIRARILTAPRGCRGDAARGRIPFALERQVANSQQDVVRRFVDWTDAHDEDGVALKPMLQGTGVRRFG
jgi:hypothetical protein